MKYFVILQDFEKGGGICAAQYGFDTLKQAQMFVRDKFEGTYIIIKGDIVEKQYKCKGEEK